MKPTYFFIIGAQRSGTTFLYHCLDSHPQISMAKPMRPEPKYFIDPPRLIDTQLYLNKFHSGCGESVRAFGEKSTSYYEIPGVATHIHNYFPNAKIILVLRNPIDRALSNYFFTRQHNLEPRTAEEVFLKKTHPPTRVSGTSVSPYNYLNRGNYSKHLLAYIKKFDIGNIKVILFDKLINNTELELCSLSEFLGVLPSLAEYPLHHSTLNKSSNNEMVSDDILIVLKDYYSDEINNLERLIKMDLSDWK